VREWLRSPENLAIAALCVLWAVVIFVIVVSEALQPGQTTGRIDLFGWRLEPRLDLRGVHSALTWLAVAGGVAALLGLVVRRYERRLEGALFVVLLTLAVAASGLAMLQYAVIRDRYFDVGDTFSYFLGPKYFDELGYDALYDCAIVAQKQAGRRLPRHVRDLATEHTRTVARWLNADRERECRARFTDERWAAFARDVETYRSWHNRSRWDRRFADHGYNGSPLFTALGGTLANAVELDHRTMVLLSLINHVVVLVMLVLVLRAFGWQVGLLFTLLFFVNPTERWLLGGAYLRFLWIASLISGLALLRLGRHALSGAAIMVSAFLTMFPAAFLGGVGITAAVDVLRRRPVQDGRRRFIVGAAAAAVVCGALSVAPAHGLGNWSEFMHQMDINSERLALGRIGFVYDFLWPKHVEWSDAAYSYTEQEANMHRPFLGPVSLVHVRYALIVVLLGLIVWLALSRRLTDLEFTVLLGFGMFFLLTNTVRYYYVGLVGLPLLWSRDPDRVAGWVCYAAALAASAAAWWLEQRITHVFAHNTFWSLTFAATIVVAIVYFAIAGRAASGGAGGVVAAPDLEREEPEQPREEPAEAD
jgi:hypothetical protein